MDRKIIKIIMKVMIVVLKIRTLRLSQNHSPIQISVLLYKDKLILHVAAHDRQHHHQNLIQTK